MKKFLLLTIWSFLNIINKLFLVGGVLIGMGFAIFGGLALIVFIIGIFLKIPDNIKFLGISAVCFSIKILVVVFYTIIQLLIDSLHEKIEKLS